MKSYIIIGGVNGAGKSSLYNEFTISERKSLGNRINADEIQKDENKSLIEASKKAVTLLNGYLNGNETFHQETTLAGKSILKNIEKARENNFEIKLYYVGLENADIAIERVAERVAKGGHDVPEELVRSRYKSSTENLQKMWYLVDEKKIYDNTQNNKLLIHEKYGKELSREEQQPTWMKQILDNIRIEDRETVKKITSILEQKEVTKGDLECCIDHCRKKIKENDNNVKKYKEDMKLFERGKVILEREGKGIIKIKDIFRGR